jgi:hypothetical protein
MAIRVTHTLLLCLLTATRSFAQSDAASDFSRHVANYAALSASLGGDAFPISSDAALLAESRQRLAGRLRGARASAAVGDIFGPEAAREFTARLRNALDAPTWAAVMDDNPGEFPCFVNSEYPEGKPSSTMPATLLSVLPTLPDGLEYRFVGRHLILRDSRAYLIIDYVPYALATCDCDQEGDSESQPNATATTR